MVANDGPKRFTSMRSSPALMLRCPALPTLRPKRNSSRAAQQRSNFNASKLISSLQHILSESASPIAASCLFVFVLVLHKMHVVFPSRQEKIQVHDRFSAQRF